MNMAMIIESVSINEKMKQISNKSKEVLTEAIKDDGDSLFVKIIYETADGTDDKTLKGKLAKAWEAIKAYAINLTNYLFIKINEKVGMYKKICDRIEDFYEAHRICEDIPVKNMYDYGNIYAKKPEDVVHKIVSSKLSKISNKYGHTIMATQKEIDSIADAIESAMNKEGLTNDTIGELKQINKIGDIEAYHIITSVTRHDKVTRELKNYLTILNGLHGIVSKLSGGNVKCEIIVMQIGAKYLSKYMRYLVDNFLQSVKISRICLNTFDENKNKQEVK